MAKRIVRNDKASAKTPTPAADVERVISDRLTQLVDSLLNLAVGVQVEKETEQGGKVYSMPPNRLAAEYLINRVLGKPAEKMQVTSADEFDEIEREMKNMRNMTTDELIQLHRKTLGGP